MKRNGVERKLFSFVPNQVTKDKLIELGFPGTLANRIVHYQLKGGKFKARKDLLKIYGMDSALYRKLYPFIELPETTVPKSATISIAPKEKPTLVSFDLNNADTAQLIKIYGIGPKLSRRIVAYREKLGGFISFDQLREVYGLDSTVVHELFKRSTIAENFKPQLIDINSATERELGNHPYIKFKLAKAITAYRFQHGPFQSVDALKKIALIDEPTFQKIKTYLSVNH